MRNSALGLLLILVSVCGTGLVWHVGGDRRMGIRVNTKDLMHEGLVMIASSDPVFDDSMGSAEQIEGLAAVKPYSVLIKNVGKKSVIAFVLKWDLVKPDGRLEVRTYKYSSGWGVMGNDLDANSGNGIRPGSAWILTPGFSAEISNLQGHNPVGREHLLARIAENLSHYTNMTASLDGAFFDDGTFVGANNTGFFEQVVALRDARRDLLDEIKGKIKNGAARDKVFSELQAMIDKKGKGLGKSATTTDYYNRFKADFAEQVVRINKISGSEKALEFVLKSSGKSWPTLRKGQAAPLNE